MALDGSLQALTKSVLKQKSKETCSIYKFFHRSDPASSASNETSEYEISHTSVPLPSSENESSVKLTEATDSKLRISTGEEETAVCHQPEPKVELWMYDFCTIDPSVVDSFLQNSKGKFKTGFAFRNMQRRPNDILIFMITFLLPRGRTVIPDCRDLYKPTHYYYCSL